MSLRKENHGIDQGEPSKTEANHGKIVTPGGGSFKEGISKLPPLNGSDNYPKQGRINHGKDKLDIVP